MKQHSDLGIGNNSYVSHWERIYLEEGPEELYKERRGRKSKGRPVNLPKQTEEDLIAEVQHAAGTRDEVGKLTRRGLMDVRK